MPLYASCLRSFSSEHFGATYEIIVSYQRKHIPGDYQINNITIHVVANITAPKYYRKPDKQSNFWKNKKWFRI